MIMTLEIVGLEIWSQFGNCPEKKQDRVESTFAKNKNR